MAEHTMEEMSEQALKACRYFGAGLEKNGRGWLGVEVDGVVLVVTRGESAAGLREQVEAKSLFGEGKHLSRAGASVEPEAAASGSPVEAREATGGEEKPSEGAAASVVLVPQFHEPPEGSTYGHGGHVHLHVLNDVKLGRRERKQGECLCSKKHGSHERMPEDDERAMCAECVKVASEHGIAWSMR